MTTIHPDMPARLGRYEIVRQLGRGAMGVVYEGLDPNIGRRVAIKTARRDVIEASGRADEMIERFLREARAAGGLNHAHIITIYDADEQDGTAYIAMEYIEGTDLQKMIGQRSRFSPEETVALGATVCEALAHAHDNGVVHRDVKPSNIMMLADGTIRVADFGIARVKDSSLTQEGAMIGTPHYMSPEQFMGQRVDGRSDLFSVGIILYELLTGEKPFHGEAISTVMHAVIKTDPIDPSALNFSVNNVLSEVIMKGLAKAPNQRYADGRAMAAALRESLKEHPNPAITLVGDPSNVGEKTILVDSSSGIDATVAMDASGASKLGGSMAETVAEGPAKTPDAPVKPSPQPTPLPLKRGPILAAVAVAVMAVAGLGIWAVMPGGEPEGSGAAVKEYSFPITISFVSNLETDPVFLPGASICFLTLDKSRELGCFDIETDSQMINLKSPETRVLYVVKHEGYIDSDGTYDLTGPDEDAMIVIAMYSPEAKRQLENPDQS